MRKLIWLLMVIAQFTVSCSDSSQFSIRGSISNAEGQYIYLDELGVDSSMKIDSFLLGNNGEFEFEGSVSFPTFYLLKLNEKNFVTLLVDSTEQVEVYGDAANFSRDYKVSGSEGSAQVQELNSRLVSTKHQLDSIESLQISFRSEIRYASDQIRWEEEYDKIKEDQIEYSTNFVKSHPFSMSNVLALYQKFDDDNYVVQDLLSLKTAATALNTFYPESEHVEALYNNTILLMQQERNLAVQQVVKDYGLNSPDIVLPNVDGEDVALSSLRGKYVLVQFWSAADKGSRYLNPVLVELYEKYHSKGFEIYQVSIDTNRYDWVDAIDADGLNWINVGDMQGSNIALMSYNVQSIPYNYLLDPEGNILAKSLVGASLNQALSQYVK